MNNIVVLSKSNKTTDGLSIVGSLAQVKYAHDIINRLQSEYPNVKLPNVRASTFWIDNQHREPDELWALSKQVNTVFTSVYPNTNRDMAVDAVTQLIKNRDELIIADFESTGIGKGSFIVQIALIGLTKTLKPVILFRSLINPNVDLKKYSKSKAASVNGITGDMVANAPTLSDVWKTIQPYLSCHWATFNTQFDIPLLLRDARRYHLDVPNIRATCIMKIASAYLNSPDWLNLDEVISELHMRLPSGLRHTAEYDAVVAARVLTKIYRLEK